jgi:microcystin-dependent protein
MSSTDNDNMYSRMPNVTSASAFVRIYTYEHSDYTTQIRDYYQTATGTVSINQTTNKPTFTTFTVANVDKTIDNDDKYGNTLISSSTSTLLGANTRMIKGYSKLRATVTSANKMVAQNYATESKYRFTSGSKYKEEDYSAVADVDLDIDNANEEDVTVTAYDSRSLTTAVNDTTTITNNAEYEAVSLWGVTLTRDNGVDSETTLEFSGSYWNEYFGGGTDGVQNTITAHYRYKESTAAWSTQTWNSITVTDTDGALSFSDYIQGDLGVSGFDTEKSFDIEVRAYDKLTNTIIEKTLSVGTPVMDITQDGVAFGDRYDATEGGDIQILGKSILDVMYPVGSIYTNASDSTNPATLMGFGTWTAFGSGRVMVGINSGDTDFDTAEETGGAKTVTLQTSMIPEHTHTQNSHYHTQPTHDHGQASHNHSTVASQVRNGDAYSWDVQWGSNRSFSLDITTAGTTANNYWDGDDNTGSTTATNQNTGGGGSHNNLQPYIVVYMWKRTA